MKISDKILNFVARFSKSARKRQETNMLLDFLGIDRDTSADALSEATYYACMKNLSETMGKLPLKIQKKTDKQGVVTVRDHPYYNMLNTRPNPYMTATTFWGTIEYNRNEYGNAYALIDTTGKEPYLWIMPSDEVEIWYDNAKILADIPDIYYIYSHGGKRYMFKSEEILHFKSFDSFDGIKGISVRDRLWTTITGNVKAQKLLNSMYENGFTAKMVVQYTGNIKDDSAKEFVKGIENYATGKIEDVKSIIPIPFGATLTPLNINFSDNQFIEIKQYSALQIASAFGIKPNQIGDYTKSSYASSEAQQLSFYVDTLLYIVKQYEEEITYKLLNNGNYAKFNVSVILRVDLATQMDTLSKAVSNFIYTPNEARAMLDKEAKEGGDQLLGNGASIPVQYAGSQYTDITANTQQREEVKQWITQTIKECMSHSQAS